MASSCDETEVKKIYEFKYNLNGSVEKHKARFVAKGYAQHYDVDYFEMFSLVSRFEPIKIFLSVAIHI